MKEGTNYPHKPYFEQIHYYRKKKETVSNIATFSETNYETNWYFS